MATTVPVPALPAVGVDLQREKAWKDALDFWTSNSKVTMAEALIASTGPDDIKAYLVDLQQQRQKSKGAALAHSIDICIDALVRHEKAIEMFAQAGGMPGCVAWGSIRLVLEVEKPRWTYVSALTVWQLAHGHTKDYERLLNTLSQIAAWLEPINMEAKIFANSAIINKYLVDLYIHIIKFWAKASVVYSSSKSTKLFGALKSIWTNYNEEFSVLKRGMDDALMLLLANATAEHHRQFDDFNKRFNESTFFS
jgi:hypothetical protein